MIKLPEVKRATITDAFKDALRNTDELLIAKFKRDIQTAPSYARTTITNQLAPHITRLERLLKYETEFDMELTKLRTMPFAKLDVLTQNNREYLYAHTQPIIAEAASNRLTHRPDNYWQLPRTERNKIDSARPRMSNYDMGEYMIFVAPSDIIVGSINRIHFIPVRDPMGYDRHMHHYVPYPSGYNSRPGWTDPVHPLDRIPSTCWGNFPNLVTSTMKDGDIVELLRILYLFTSRLNPSSPLRGFDSLKHIKELPRENPISR